MGPTRPNDSEVYQLAIEATERDSYDGKLLAHLPIIIGQDRLMGLSTESVHSWSDL
jgi:hypothetical protein